MNEINLYEKEQITRKIINFISQEPNFSSKNITPDLVINKGKYRLDSETIHMILARIADDTGISMITLRRMFPYDRYFITCKSENLVILGIFIFIVGVIISFIEKATNIDFLLFLVFFIETIALLQFLDTCFIRNGKPELTIALFAEIVVLILNKHRNELICGVQLHERQLWRSKIYEVLK